MTSPDFAGAIAAIDALNAEDPNTLTFRDRTGAKELLHASLAADWVKRLRPDASDALLLAARAHHVRRWEIPRSSYPAGRKGYLDWRRDLQAFHARTCAAVLERHGYDRGAIDRVGELIQKRNLGSDTEAQVLEDALCLVFLETQAGAFADTEPKKVGRVLVQTLRKMSDEGRRAVRGLELVDAVAALVHEALDRATARPPA